MTQLYCYSLLKFEWLFRLPEFYHILMDLSFPAGTVLFHI